MSDCTLDPGSVSLLVKEHLLPAGEGEEWVSAWTEDCVLQAGVVLRIPYDPDAINAVEVDPSPPPEEGEGDGGEENPQPDESSSSAAPLPAPPPEESNTENLMPPETDNAPEAAAPEAHEVALDPTQGLTGELNSLAQTTGADPTLTVLLALIAVLGGGAAWKFYRQHSEQKHEQELQKLKMEAKSKGMEGDPPGPCQTVHAQLKAEVEELKNRLNKMDNKLSLNADFDGDEIERKVRKLEKWRRSLEDDSEDA